MPRRSRSSSDEHLKQKALLAALLVGGLAVGGAATYVGTSMGGISADAAGEKVASTLEDSTGNEYEVVDVSKRSGMYEVRLSNNGNLQTYFVTEDGKFLSGALTDLEQVQQTIDTRNSVNSCLEDKDAVLYGNVSQQPTQVQIQLLGGAQQVASYYKDVNNPANLQEAAQRGVSSVPSLYVNNETLSDVNNLSQIEEFAECSQ
jgi:hypothetical protein